VLIRLLRSRLIEDVLASAPIVVGLSGGRDSISLAAALSECCPSERLYFVHVNHGLSPFADEWSALCEQFALERGVRYACFRVAIESTGKGLEAAARDARWKIFRTEVPENAVLALAHHLEDQAETVLFRALRGTGVAGLGGMTRLSQKMGLQVWRPWLDQSRTDITDFAVLKQLQWVEDASNSETRFSRNYLRQIIWPLLKVRFPMIATTLGRLAEHASEASELLIERAFEDLALLREQGKPDVLKLKAFLDLSLPRQRNVLRYWLNEVGWPFPEQRTLFEWQRQLLRVNGASQTRLAYSAGVCVVQHGCLYRIAIQHLAQANSFLD
jgi:tRNA(Ile)-lysidine synthase